MARRVSSQSAARLCSQEFLQQARHPDFPMALSRNRKLLLVTLVAVIMIGMRMNIQAELDTCWSGWQGRR